MTTVIVNTAHTAQTTAVMPVIINILMLTGSRITWEMGLWVGLGVGLLDYPPMWEGLFRGRDAGLDCASGEGT